VASWRHRQRTPGSHYAMFRLWELPHPDDWRRSGHRHLALRGLPVYLSNAERKFAWMGCLAAVGVAYGQSSSRCSGSVASGPGRWAAGWQGTLSPVVSKGTSVSAGAVRWPQIAAARHRQVGVVCGRYVALRHDRLRRRCRTSRVGHERTFDTED